MFILSSTSRDLEFWSVNHTSVYENSELKVLRNTKRFGEISSNWTHSLLRTNVYKTYEPCW